MQMAETINEWHTKCIQNNTFENDNDFEKFKMSPSKI